MDLFSDAQALLHFFGDHHNFSYTLQYATSLFVATEPFFFFCSALYHIQVHKSNYMPLGNPSHACSFGLIRYVHELWLGSRLIDV